MPIARSGRKTVLNLVSSAFQFTFAGRIAVRLRMVGTNVESAVEDCTSPDLGQSGSG